MAPRDRIGAAIADAANRHLQAAQPDGPARSPELA
jgi:hypothetical protein